MALDTFKPYLFVSAGEQSNKFLTPAYADGIAQFQAQRAQSITGLTVRIDPIQSGTGDPSPTNIRPISGRTGMTVAAAGKNLYDISKINRLPYRGVVVERVGDKLHVYGTATDTGGFAFGDFHLIPGSYVYSSTTENLPMALLKGYTQLGGTIPTPFNVSSISDTYRFRFPIVNGATYDFYISNVQIELGSTATAYTPYQGETYTIQLGQTVYGGTLDVVSGVLTVTDAQIASYAGETLPGEWISDRDVYAAGTTPTTGAQVVYKLATPQTYQLTPTEIKTLAGFNQIYSDAGPVIDIKF